MIKRLTLRVARYHNTDPSKLQSISAKPFFKHYQSAITLQLSGNLKQANEQFTKSLYQIKLTKQKELQHYTYILRRIAHNQRRLGQMKQAQQKLYEVIKHKRQCGTNSLLLYDDYDRLHKHMLSYDLQKAIKLCKALMLKEKDQMPMSSIKLFNFNLANAYLLSGNYMDAKNRYSKCLQADPQGNLKAYAYNNLGLACWWHKNPLQKLRQQTIDDPQRIQKDFMQAKSLFAKSISISQSASNQTNQIKKMLMSEVLDFKKGTLSQKLEFDSPASIFPMHNLAEYYISNDPFQKVQILYWLKKCLTLSKAANKQKHFDRILVQYSLLTNNIDSLLQKLPSLIQKYRYSQQFAQQSTFCHILGNLLADNKQPSMRQKSKQYLNRAQQIRSILPGWSWKMKYVAMDELDLLQK